MKSGVVPLARKLAAAEEYTLPWQEYEKHEFDDFFFFLPKRFTGLRETNTDRPTGEYVTDATTGGEMILVHKTKEQTVASIGRWDKEALKVTCEREARVLAARQVQDGTQVQWMHHYTIEAWRGAL